MAPNDLGTIDHSAQLTHEWVNDLTDRLGWASPRDALRLFRVTVTSVRDHLSHDEAAQFAAQMPQLVRGMYFEGWRPSSTPRRDRRVEDFVASIEREVGAVPEYSGRDDIGTVFRFLNGRISKGEVANVRAALPRSIRGLWPAP